MNLAAVRERSVLGLKGGLWTPIPVEHAPRPETAVLACFFLWARGLACTPLRYMSHALEGLGGPVCFRPTYRARVAGAGELYSKKAGATPLKNGPHWLPQEPGTQRKGRGEGGVGRTCRRPRWAPGVQTAAARVYRGQLATSVSRGSMQGRGGLRLRWWNRVRLGKLFKLVLYHLGVDRICIFSGGGFFFTWMSFVDKR